MLSGFLPRLRGAWVVGGDWNMTPTELGQSGFLSHVGGSVCSSGLITCTSGSGRELDSFVAGMRLSASVSASVGHNPDGATLPCAHGRPRRGEQPRGLRARGTKAAGGGPVRGPQKGRAPLQGPVVLADRPSTARAWRRLGGVAGARGSRVAGDVRPRPRRSKVEARAAQRPQVPSRGFGGPRQPCYAARPASRSPGVARPVEGVHSGSRPRQQARVGAQQALARASGQALGEPPGPRIWRRDSGPVATWPKGAAPCRS